jgi:hypothetical protein
MMSGQILFFLTSTHEKKMIKGTFADISKVVKKNKEEKKKPPK